MYKASITYIKFTSTDQKKALNYPLGNLFLKKETDGNSTNQHAQFLKISIKAQYHIPYMFLEK